jgi:hypothetical protein
MADCDVTKLRGELARVRAERRRLETLLPSGSFAAADLSVDQRRVFTNLCRLLAEEQNLSGAEWASAAGKRWSPLAVSASGKAAWYSRRSKPNEPLLTPLPRYCASATHTRIGKD